MTTFEMLVENELTDGVFAISLVDSPAILTDYVLLSENEINKISIELKLEKLQDAQRKIVCGPALIPDMIIPRKNFDMVFSKDTIRKISENFLINNYKDNVTLQHQVNVNKIYMVESWIVEDPNTDKSKVLGFDVPQGTWMVSFKVQDEALWTEYIQSGVLKGFSIEGNFSQKEVKMCVHDEDDLDLEIIEIIEMSRVKVKSPKAVKTTYELADLDSFYKWQMSNEKENCPACIGNNGKVKKLRQWLIDGLPRVQNGTSIDFEYKGSVYKSMNTNYKTNPYSTFCETACNCELILTIKNPMPRFK